MNSSHFLRKHSCQGKVTFASILYTVSISLLHQKKEKIKGKGDAETRKKAVIFVTSVSPCRILLI